MSRSWNTRWNASNSSGDKRKLFFNFENQGDKGAFVVLLIRAVKALIRQPRIRLFSAIGLHPFFVACAWTKIIYNIKELKPGCKRKSIWPISLRFFSNLCNEVFSDKVQIISARVEPNNRNLVLPLFYKGLLRLWKTFNNFWKALNSYFFSANSTPHF